MSNIFLGCAQKFGVEKVGVEKVRRGKGDIHFFLTIPVPFRYVSPMPRTARAADGGIIYHVLNRGNGRMGIFRKPGDYQAFVELLIVAKVRAKVELFGFCLMPNHWHLVLRPKEDSDLAAYLSWLSNTHVKRYRAHYRRTSGHLYQGRYKSFPVEEEHYFLRLMRYVEANPLRAKLVERAQDWEWSSAGCGSELSAKMLDAWPVDRPSSWLSMVNRPLPESEAKRLKESLTAAVPSAANDGRKRQRPGLACNTRSTRVAGRGSRRRNHRKVDVTFFVSHRRRTRCRRSGLVVFRCRSVFAKSIGLSRPA
jgi:putative transposase